MHSFSSEIAPVVGTLQDTTSRLSGLQKAPSISPSQSRHRTTTGAPCLFRIAYLVTDDEQLGGDLSVAIEYSGIRAKWFRTASEYLTYSRPEIASCLLISRQLSDMSGLDLQRVLALTSSPPIIFLSDRGDIPSCVRAIKEGALDFLMLPLITPHLLEAMEAAFRKDGATLLLRQQSEELRNRWHSLTSREAEVMRYAVGGFLNKQTAIELGIAENTVQVHRGRVMRKMGADSFAELVRMSLQLAECGERTLLEAASEQTQKLPSTLHRDERSAEPSVSLKFNQRNLSLNRNVYA